jgi:tetratricopeptide (TPR) repeat protein
VAKFDYKAIDSEGNETSGVVEAETENNALNLIGRQGLYVTSIHKAHIGTLLRQRWTEQKELRRKYVEEKRAEARRKHPRQRLVVRYKDGRIQYGVCFALNPQDTGFHLDTMTREGATTGETIQIRFNELKAVFQVKSFDGHFNSRQKYPEYHPEGKEYICEFGDGEIIRGFTLRPYDPDAERFFLIPTESSSNNISILVERSALAHVYTPEQYEEKRLKEIEERSKETVASDVTHEESMGDFYFETRNYPAALQQYKAAMKAQPRSVRLRKKILATEYNIAVQFIKRREYEKALAGIEKILEADPSNPHARKKVAQLRRIIDKEKFGQPSE